MIGRAAPLIALLLLSGACNRAPAVSARPPQANLPPASPGARSERVKPPAEPCLQKKGGSLRALLARATSDLEQGRAERSLGCAEEALRLDPWSPAALHQRAASLVALGRLDDARLAYARALAADPDDPYTLLGAADLYVSHLSGERDEIELGLQYALRGARPAQRQHARAVASELLLVAATAENDLGLSAAALEHAQQALRLGADEADAQYERGVALYELCRFQDARRALQRVLSLQPADPWALHELALVTERIGDDAGAAALERRARTLAPADLPAAVEVAPTEFERELQRALAELPESERRALRGVPVEVAELPALDDLTAVDPPLSPSILGLFRGPSEQERCLPEDGAPCRSIVFYRRNLARFARSPGELRDQLRVTLLHELGHLHGESDEELRARGLE